jgi:hypothetical protein
MQPIFLGPGAPKYKAMWEQRIRHVCQLEEINALDVFVAIIHK